MKVCRGEIYFADLNPVTGSEQGGLRPVLVLQNDVGNKHSPTTIVAAITSRIHKARLPTHVRLPKGELDRDSVILLEQLRTIDKARLRQRVTRLDRLRMEEVDEALEISLGLAVF
ncbi:MAG: type II toxin-antitoxin system PemK/MazF family toxin [Chitinophagales bacterium]